MAHGVRHLLTGGQYRVTSVVDQIVDTADGLDFAGNAGLRLGHVHLNDGASGFLNPLYGGGGLGLFWTELTTLWPAQRTRRTNARPRPIEAPVMSQTGEDMMLIFSLVYL